MKNSKLILFFSLLLFSASNVSAQGPDKPRTKWTVCKYPASGTCNVDPPIACVTAYTENDIDGSSVDPCKTNNHPYPVTNPSMASAVCCSNIGIHNPTSANDGRFNYFGVNMFLGVKNFVLYAQCESASGGYIDSIWDFSDIIDTAWGTVVVNAYIDSSNHFLVIEAWEGSEDYLWTVANGRSFVNIPQAFVTGHCGGSTPSLGLGKIGKTAKVTTSFSPNPLSIGEHLSYSILNPQSLNDDLKFTIYNAQGQIIHEFTPTAQSGTIDSSKFPAGTFIICVTSKFSKENYTIVIK